LKDSKDEIHANVPELEEVVPKIGIEFETEQKTYISIKIMHMQSSLVLGKVGV